MQNQKAGIVPAAHASFSTAFCVTVTLATFLNLSASVLLSVKWAYNGTKAIGL